VKRTGVSWHLWKKWPMTLRFLSSPQPGRQINTWKSEFCNVVQSKSHQKTFNMCVSSFLMKEPGMVMHALNHNYLEQSSEKINSSMSAPEKLGRSYLKNKIQTKGLAVWLKC
jgi:hypothetical protein